MKKLGECDVAKAGKRSRDTLFFRGGCDPEQPCVREGRLGGEEGCSSGGFGRKVIALCFPLPKLQTLIVNIKGPAWPSKASEVYVSPPPYLQLIPSNFPEAASFIYKLVGSTMFK